MWYSILPLYDIVRFPTHSEKKTSHTTVYYLSTFSVDNQVSGLIKFREDSGFWECITLVTNQLLRNKKCNLTLKWADLPEWLENLQLHVADQTCRSTTYSMNQSHVQVNKYWMMSVSIFGHESLEGQTMQTWSYLHGSIISTWQCIDAFLSPPVHKLHVGLSCITFCLSVCRLD